MKVNSKSLHACERPSNKFAMKCVSIVMRSANVIVPEEIVLMATNRYPPAIKRLNQMHRRVSVRWRMRFLSCLAAFVPALAGCSAGKAPTYHVTGTVKLPDGTPLAGGRILFRPEGETVFAGKGEIGPDGSFELSTFGLGDGAVAGTHKVMVLPPTPEGAMDDVRKAAANALRIDLSYQSLRTTPLEYTVEAGGDNHFDVVVDPLKVRSK